MQKLNFLPKSYINRYNNRYFRIYFLIIIILFICNTGMIYINYRKYIDYKNIKERYDAEQIKISERNLESSNKNIQKPDDMLVEEYYAIQWRYSEQSLKEMEISKADIKIKSFHEELQQYIDFIKLIEKDKNLKITNLQPPIIGEFGIESNIVLNYIR